MGRVIPTKANVRRWTPGPTPPEWADAWRRPTQWAAEPGKRILQRTPRVNWVNEAAPSSIVWAPGHYGLSDQTVRSVGSFGSGATADASNMASVHAEINMLGGAAGYCMNFTWDYLDFGPSAGDIGYGAGYDFTALDQALAWLPAGAKLIVGVQSGYGSLHVPSYIVGDPSMGSSSVGGQYGWWYGWSGGFHYAAKWRSAVNARWIALFAALDAWAATKGSRVAALVDRDETALTLDVGSDFTTTADLTEWTARAAAMSTAGRPFVQQANWANGGNEPNYTAALYANRGSLGGPDIFGAAVPTNYVNTQYAYIGGTVNGYTSPDYRQNGSTGPLMPLIHDVQSPELLGPSYGGFATAYTPLDLVTRANSDFKPAIVIWNMLTYGPTEAQWSNLLPVVLANPVTGGTYPIGAGW